MNKALFLFSFLALPSLSFCQNEILGKWKTIDDETGKPRSVVEIYQDNGKIFGKIVQLFREPNEEPDPNCDKCEGDKYNKKVKGMVIIESLTKSGSYYSNGTILDPKNGKVYSCKVWLQNGDLMVRGYWGPFYRTQTWKKFS